MQVPGHTLAETDSFGSGIQKPVNLKSSLDDSNARHPENQCS